ncbi:MAG: DUF3052 domain-containing protein [Propionibacteriaceae bacterium]|jgi:hypothetical protein|nr:DUF3052 domain-containing protein [Propionibacteriaceae bacterium]
MGLRPGAVVQELGWDEDTDDELRLDIQEAVGEEFVYEAVDAVDCVLLWWREDDGDLADGLVDALTDLGDGGRIWLMTPKIGQPGYVSASDISEAVLTAGLAEANTASVSPKWQAHKIVRPKVGRR